MGLSFGFVCWDHSWGGSGFKASTLPTKLLLQPYFQLFYIRVMWSTRTSILLIILAILLYSPIPPSLCHQSVNSPLATVLREFLPLPHLTFAASPLFGGQYFRDCSMGITYSLLWSFMLHIWARLPGTGLSPTDSCHWAWHPPIFFVLIFRPHLAVLTGYSWLSAHMLGNYMWY